MPPTQPQWFAAEVTSRLRKVKRAAGSLQHYACCPVPAHDDQHASMGIRPGDNVPLIYHCQKGCAPEEIREALAALGIAEEHLGPYGTPEYEARRQTRASGDEWRQIERLRNEMADLKNGLRGLLAADLSLAMLKVRILAVVEGSDVPAGRKEYVAFAIKAGVSQPRAYAAWKSDPLAQCVTEDHVVLTHPDENRQAAQVTAQDGVIEPRKALSNREGSNSRNDNSRNEKTDMETAMRTLHDGGLTDGRPAA